MKRTEVDGFVRNQNKSLAGDTPVEMEVYGFRSKKSRIDILLNGHTTGIYLATQKQNLIDGSYTVIVETPSPIWVVVFAPTSVWTGNVVTPGGKIKRCEILGSRYYSWWDNRLGYPEDGGLLMPCIARPLPSELTGYRDVVKWIAGEMKIKLPKAPVFIPQGLK